ncbi:MAG: Rrf2 family transcriptional regulator [Bacteroidetes bacterium]|nr:Rrf2 family transcriptional regulator [Bacteroidota bacterium]MBU1373282.1 Rrf2 family transcriptional regulator [Bacteroidota bacterium]MBU1484226.1 Rrf2 family transcriptional regulator [Bacteroidota bacterium]MBU1760808.1 Rrf2 family transcriptional regulator [Bacteroidota bacterium]MBU2268356.1 Rrf2 family transcriptional regulator [Bacteroidota bacterium]
MGIFSKTCEYAIRSVFFIAHKTADGGRVGIKEIAKGISSPEPFLAKILQDLSRRGIVQSVKGPNGGFFMDKNTLKRPLADVVEAVDGNNLFTGCGLGLEYCSESNPCPLHHEFKDIRNKIHHMLLTTSIEDFNDDLNLGIISLKK